MTIHCKTSIFFTKEMVQNSYASSNILSNRGVRTSCSVALRFRNHAFSIGDQLRAELDINTMPFRDTVAGDALSML